MREFILRARKGPTSPSFDPGNLPASGRLDIVAHCIANAVFYAQHIREHTHVHVVLDGPADPPKTVRFETDTLGSLAGFDERSIGTALKQALARGEGLQLREERRAADGVYVSKLGFEHLIKDRAETGLYYLNPKGADIRDTDLPQNPCFAFTDHLSMPRKTDRYLDRLGAVPISLGPRVLFASQCIVVVHNELDRRRIP